MNYLELSIDGAKKQSVILAQKIADSNFRPDCVVFIAKGAYLIGDSVAAYFNIPLLEISASRKTNRFKSSISTLLKYIPRSVRKLLRKTELRSGFHAGQTGRDVSFPPEKWEPYKDSSRILIVDDSVDSGNTALAVTSAVRAYFPCAQIRFASLNYFPSLSAVTPDYFLYQDTILCGPWSKDSEEYHTFIAMYQSKILTQSQRNRP